jgi:uncharacterized RDD family membrane protein YckC
MRPVTVEETAIARAPAKPRAVVKTHERVRAPFSLRCGAILIDYIILVSILALSTLIARMLGGGARTAGTSSETGGILLTIAIAVLNMGVLAGLTGFTIGKWATGLRIERPDGSEVGIGRAFLRHFLGYPLSLLLLGLGFAIAAFGPRGRALHDLIAGTVVVREGPAIRRKR